MKNAHCLLWKERRSTGGRRDYGMKSAVYGGQRLRVMARNPPEIERYETALCSADELHSD